MIVSRDTAEAARATLEIAPALDDIDAALLKSIFRLRAIEHHPDKGGAIETFVAMDRAKCILERWIERRATEGVPKAVLTAKRCPRCHGKGRVTLHRGFTPYAVRCITCNGTGDGGYDHDRARE